MSRLIDADELLKSIDEACLCCGKQGTFTCKNDIGICLYQDMRERIEEISESVVRCKDCKRWNDEWPGCTEHIKVCMLAHYLVGGNGFCAYGERRTDETD